VQEETTALGIPCLTLRENTERPITVTEGTNTIVGLHPDHVLAAVQQVPRLAGKRRPEKWDGHAAERIVEHLLRHFHCRAELVSATLQPQAVLETIP
jgi:UDP-N-acetylglucosamine 2-epimerase (non-hydrolysing)